MEVTLRQPHGTEIDADGLAYPVLIAADKLRAAAADVDDEQLFAKQ